MSPQKQTQTCQLDDKQKTLSKYSKALQAIPNKEIRDVVAKLLSLGLSPIPVVSAQDWEGNFIPKGMKPGKVPSYLGKNGKPRLLKPRKQELFSRIPYPEEIKLWFADTRTGIGSYGSLDGKLRWIDVDVENFKSLNDCKNAVAAFRQVNRIMDAWTERSGSGGYTILVEFENPPDYQKFSFPPELLSALGIESEAGLRHGEIQKWNNFKVLAPSLHPSGNNYEHIKGDTQGKLKSAEAAGLNKYTEQKAATTTRQLVDKEISKPSTTSAGLPQDFYSWEDIRKAEHIINTPNMLYRANEGETWFKVGCAIKSIDSSSRGLDIWKRWSQNCPEKYKLTNFSAKWDSIIPGKITLGSLIKWAKDDGLIFPCFDRKDRQSFRNSQGFKTWLEQNKFTPDIILPENTPHLDIIKLIPENEDVLVFVKAGLGRGKSHSKAEIVVKRNNGGIHFYSINDLALNSIENLKKLTGDNNHHHIRFDLNGIDKAIISDPNSHIHGCSDSANKFKDDDSIDKDIYLDELVANMSHLAGGETLKGNQATIIRKFISLGNNASGIFCFDGNLTDKEVELVSSLFPNKRVIKILDPVKSGKRKATLIKGFSPAQSDKKESKIKTKDRDITAIIKRIKKSVIKGEKLWVGSDSKSFGKILEEELLTGEDTKDLNLRILIINSENSSEPEIKEFKKSPKEWLEKNIYDVVITSPSCGYGLDVHNPIIDGKPWFTEQYYIFRGVFGTQSQLQIMRRLRDNDVPTFIHCPPKSTLNRGITKNCVTAQEVISAINDVINNSTEGFKDNKQFIEKITEAIKEVNKPFPRYHANATVQDNFEKDNLYECLLYILEETGYEVEEQLLEISPKTKDKLDKAKERVNTTDANEIFRANDITEEKYEEYKKTELNKQQTAEKQKHRILKDLPGIQDAKDWTADLIKERYIEERGKAVEALKLNELLNYPEISYQKLYVDWAVVFGNNEYKSTLSPVAMSKTVIKHQRPEAFVELGIRKIRDEMLEGRELHKDDKDLREIVDKWRASYIHIIGISPELPQKRKGKILENSDVIPSIKKLLDLIALPIKAKKKKINGKTERIYTLNTESIKGLEVIAKYIKLRIEQEVKESQERFEDKKLGLELEQTFSDPDKNTEQKVKEIREKVGGRDKLAEKRKIIEEACYRAQDPLEVLKKNLEEILTTKNRTRLQKLIEIHGEEKIRSIGYCLDSQHLRLEIEREIDAVICAA